MSSLGSLTNENLLDLTSSLENASNEFESEARTNAKQKLSNKVSEAQTKLNMSSYYTTDTVIPLRNAVEHANQILNSSDQSIEIYNDEYTKVQTAINGLIFAGEIQ